MATNYGSKRLVVGAHYDTVPGCPGANDNGSGVAAMLELARRVAGHREAVGDRDPVLGLEVGDVLEQAAVDALARRPRDRGDAAAAEDALDAGARAGARRDRRG